MLICSQVQLLTTNRWQILILRATRILQLALLAASLTLLSYEERGLFGTAEQRATVLFGIFHIEKRARNRFPNFITSKKKKNHLELIKIFYFDKSVMIFDNLKCYVTVFHTNKTNFKNHFIKKMTKYFDSV